MKGKHYRQPFKNKGTRATEILGLILSDLCGPMEEKSFSGAKYFLTIIDDFSRKVFVYFLTEMFFPVVEEVETDEPDEQPIQLQHSERILEQKRKNAVFTIQTEQYKDPENVEEASRLSTLARRNE